MFTIEVIPLQRGSQVGGLTYYSAVAYEVGTLLSVPVRNQEVAGLVVGVEPVSKAKAALRQAAFSLRKLPVQENVRTLPPVLLETAKRLQQTTPASLGAILFALLPEEIRDGRETLESNLPCVGEFESGVVSLLQATEAERLRTYKSYIREAFAHRGSVLCVVPTTAHMDKVAEFLSEGISERLIVFSPALPGKRLAASYEALRDLSQAKLIVTTPSHICVDRHDITHIIIEGSGSPYFKSRIRPYLDAREVLRTLSKVAGRQVIMGDLLPSAEDEQSRRDDLYQSEGEYPKRLVFESKFKIVKQQDKPKGEAPFQLFSAELLNNITATLKARKNVFLYSARRGLAPVVACSDCGHIFRCPDSGTPYSLLRTLVNGEERRWFLSSVSGKRVPASNTCQNCGSWRLRERGIGIQHIYDELKEIFGKEKIVLFDHTTATTLKKARMLMSDFYDKKGNILLATAAVLPYLERPVALSAIVSSDAARSIPSWRAEEEFFVLLLKLRECSSSMVIVQVRTESDQNLLYAKDGAVERFYTEELALRRELNYPPFAVFVHLTIAGTSESVQALKEEASKILQGFQPHFYNSPLTNEKKTVCYGLIRVARNEWPDSALMALLLQLPPSVRIEIDPSRIV